FCTHEAPPPALCVRAPDRATLRAMIEDPPAVRIRAVEARDVEPLAALVREVLAEFGLEFGFGSATDEDVLRLPASYLDHGGAFWIAEDELGLLGSCGIFPLDAATFE